MWLILVISVAIASVAWLWRSDGAYGGTPPGPWGLPLLGYLPFLNPKAPHKTLTDLSYKYGRKYGVFSLNLGRVRTIVLTDPKLIRQALSKDEFSGRAPLYLTHGIMQGYGLICSEGALWREQRRFATSCLKTMGMVRLGGRRSKLATQLSDAASECVRMLESEVTTPVDALPALQHTLGNAMNAIVFGKQYEVDDVTWKWLQHLQEEGTKMIGVAGPLNFLPWLRFIPYFQRMIHFLLDGKSKTHDIYREILREHSETGSDGHMVGAFLAEMARRGSDDVGSFTEPQCLHALADLFGAGVDTTLATLRWFLVMQAAHPDAQTRMQEELDTAVSTRGADCPDLIDLPNCPFSEAALAETQRLRSVVPLGIPHGAVKDCELGGFMIPKGTMVVPLQWAVHTDPLLWGSNALEYHPDRFLSPEGRFSRPEFFIPFQTGKRTCLGEELARMLLFTFGARLVHKFNVRFAPDTDVENVLEGECGITLTPKPHRFILTTRN